MVGVSKHTYKQGFNVWLCDLCVGEGHRPVNERKGCRTQPCEVFWWFLSIFGQNLNNAESNSESARTLIWMRGFEGRIFIPALVSLLKGYRLMRGSTSGISSWAFPQVLTKTLLIMTVHSASIRDSCPQVLSSSTHSITHFREKKRTNFLQIPCKASMVE